MGSQSRHTSKPGSKRTRGMVTEEKELSHDPGADLVASLWTLEFQLGSRPPPTRHGVCRVLGIAPFPQNGATLLLWFPQAAKNNATRRGTLKKVVVRWSPCNATKKKRYPQNGGTNRKKGATNSHKTSHPRPIRPLSS